MRPPAAARAASVARHTPWKRPSRADASFALLHGLLVPQAEARRISDEAEVRLNAMAEADAHAIALATSQRDEAAREVELAHKAESAVRQQAEDRMHEAMAAQRDAELAEQASARRAEEMAVETERLREATRLQTSAQRMAAQEADAARRVKEAEAVRRADAERREARASETARQLAHDVLNYHSRFSNQAWEHEARWKALKALGLPGGAATEALDLEGASGVASRARSTSFTTPSVSWPKEGGSGSSGYATTLFGNSGPRRSTPRALDTTASTRARTASSASRSPLRKPFLS